MDEHMDKNKLLGLIQAERIHLESLLGHLSNRQMLHTAVQGEWTIKDIFAHITAWEQRLLTWLQATKRNETPIRPEPGATWDDIDRINECSYQASRNRQLNDVLRDARHSYQQVLEMVQSFSEEDLTQPGRYTWTEDAPLWLSIKSNTYEHYHEHAEAIRAEMEKMA